MWAERAHRLFRVRPDHFELRTANLFRPDMCRVRLKRTLVDLPGLASPGRSAAELWLVGGGAALGGKSCG